MTKVYIFKFRNYDIHVDEYQTSNRYATKDWIDRWGFEPIVDSGVEVPSDDIAADGLAPRGYNPRSKIRSGFQSMM